MRLLVPSLDSSVPSSIVRVSPLRPVTTPVTRSNPEPCTLEPASTCVAENETLVVIVPVVEPEFPVVSRMEPSVHVSTPFTVWGVVPSEQVSVVPVVLLDWVMRVDPSRQLSTPFTVCGVVPSEQVSIVPVLVVPMEEPEVLVEEMSVP